MSDYKHKNYKSNQICAAKQIICTDDPRVVRV